MVSQAYAAQQPGQISQQQLEQFKRLPAAQQRTLAKSMGVDLNQIKSQMNRPAAVSRQQLPAQQSYPRGTQFDQFGQPVLTQEMDLPLNKTDVEVKPFGYNVFANAPATFAPLADIAIPNSYIIGPGDSLSVQIFGKENLQYSLAVSREGQVVIPQLGPFSVAGLSFTELKSYLGNEITNKILGVNVVITLDELRSLRVFVLGDAFKPGPYVLNALSSMTHAIFGAGGINDIGSLRNIELRRNGKLINKLDLYDLLIRGDSSKDLLLRSGDVVFVPPVGEQVTVIGEVRRPAIYELQSGATFDSVLNTAGGLLPSAYPAATVVERFNQHRLRAVVNIDLSKATHLKQDVKNGDFIRIMKTSDQFDQSVTLIGAVTRPGKYQWHSEQRISDLLPSMHAYVLKDADLNYGLVVREKDIGRNIEVLQFSLFNALSNPASLSNMLLQAHDKIIIFSNTEKPDSENLGLDYLAMTKQALHEKEKKRAKEKHTDRLFWSEYGSAGSAKAAHEQDAQVIDSQSIVDRAGGAIKDQVNIQDLALFSRQRLLTPIIEKLKQQASAGQPLQLVEVAGSVKYPGIYPLAVNNKVNQVVLAAGGLLESAYLGRTQLTRNVINDGTANKLSVEFNLQAALAGDQQNNIILHSKDRINIHQIPAWQENLIIELRGEFVFPGKYTIRRGETLTQLIDRAGGYTNFAYTDGSVFTRRKLKQLEKQNLVRVAEGLRMEIASKSLAQSRNSNVIDYSQAKLLLNDLTKITPVGRLVVDLDRISDQPAIDVLLEDGDVLYVPTKQNSINVVGQVQVATSHMFQPGLNAGEYVSLSGGLKQQADAERIYIIKANGSVEVPPQNNNWFAAAKQTGLLEPGDTVVVPLNSEYMDQLTLWSTGTQIIYQAAVAIAAISGI